jgi:hypothetical protein
MNAEYTTPFFHEYQIDSPTKVLLLLSAFSIPLLKVIGGQRIQRGLEVLSSCSLNTLSSLRF